MRPGVLVASVFVLATTGCSPGASSDLAPSRPGGQGVPATAQRAVVDHIVDGDTFWVRASGPGSLRTGVRSKVRLLEYDTPERGQCWFAEATRELTQLTPVGTTVWLGEDRELLDRYGRALRYVWTPGGVLVDVEMVRRGMGKALLVKPNDAHIAEVRAAERLAQAGRRGLWGGC